MRNKEIKEKKLFMFSFQTIHKVYDKKNIKETGSFISDDYKREPTYP